MLGAALLLGSIVLCRPLLVEVLGSAIGEHAVLTRPVQGALWRLTILWAFLFLVREPGIVHVRVFSSSSSHLS